MQTDIDSVVQQIKQENNFITKAKLMRFLNVDKALRIKDLAKKLGMKESYICHILRLNKLTDYVVDGYYSKLISISHLFIISRLHTQEDIAHAYEEVLTNSYSVSRTEELIREMLYKTKTVGSHMTPDELKQYGEKIKTKYGVHVKAVQTRVKSRLILELPGSLAETTPVLRDIIKTLSRDEGSAGEPDKAS